MWVSNPPITSSAHQHSQSELLIRKNNTQNYMHMSIYMYRWRAKEAEIRTSEEFCDDAEDLAALFVSALDLEDLEFLDEVFLIGWREVITHDWLSVLEREKESLK